MKKKSKILLICCMIVLFLFLGTIILRIGIEHVAVKQLQYASNKFFGRELYIRDASYNLFSHVLSLRGIRIENPIGYSNKNPAVAIDEIRCQFSPFALLRRLVHIRKLYVSNIEINFEIKKIPTSLPELLEVIINPEINIIALRSERDRTLTSSDIRQNSIKKSITPWLIRVDDFQVSNTRIRFINLKLVAILLPKPYKTLIRDGFPIPEYKQEALGVPGGLTVDAIIQEIYQRHLNEIKGKFEGLKEWLEGKLKRSKKGSKDQNNNQIYLEKEEKSRKTEMLPKVF